MKKKVLVEIIACAECPHFSRSTYFCSKLGRRSMTLHSGLSVWENVPDDCPLPEVKK